VREDRGCRFDCPARLPYDGRYNSRFRHCRLDAHPANDRRKFSGVATGSRCQLRFVPDYSQSGQRCTN
jgi:hypothetical protein